MSVSTKIAAKGAVALSVVTGLLAGGLVLAGGAQAAAPSYEPDSNAVGTVALYNASGVQITSGSTSAHPFAFYFAASGGNTVGSPAGSSAATAYAATPQDGQNSQIWPSDTLTATTPFGASVSASYPGALKDSPNAIAKATSTDFSLDDYISNAPAASTANPDVYQIRVSTGNAAKFYTMDVQVTGSTWTQVYPAVAPPAPYFSPTSITATPASPTTEGTSVSLKATVSNPVAGSARLFDGSTDKGAATYDPNTGAVSAADTPVQGNHTYKFTFTPSDTAVSPFSSDPLSYQVNPAPPKDTTTVVSGPTTAATTDTVVYSATVKAGTSSVSNGAGTVQFAVNGTNVGSPVALVNGAASYSTTFAAGTYKVTASFTHASGQLYNDSADATGVTTVVSPDAPPADPQDVVVNVPKGSLIISTPYTAANPFVLGNLVLDSSGTGYTASADFGSKSAIAGNATADPNATTGTLPANATPAQVDAYKAATNGKGNGITITDTRANSQGWNAFASTTDFTNPALDTPIDGNNLTFHDLKVKYVAGNAIQNGVAVSDIDHFKVAKKQFAANTNKKPGTVAIAGTLTLTAPTSTKAGQYTATITFTVV